MSGAYKLVTRAGVFFLLSFLLAAAMNVLPQVHFTRYARARRGELLEVFLLLGTVAAILGVRASRWHRRRGELRRGPARERGSLALLAVSLATFAALFTPCVAWAYVAAGMALRFVANFLIDTLDHRFIVDVEPGRHARYDAAFVLARLAALVLGPLYFALLYDELVARGLVLVGGGALAAWVLVREARSRSPRSAPVPTSMPALAEPARLDEAPPVPPPSGPGAAMALADYALAGAMVLLVATLFAFSTQTIYLVEHYYGSEHARSRGGLLLALTQAMAVTVVVGRALVVERWPRARVASPWGYLPVCLVPCVPIAMLRLGWRPSLAGCAALCATLGLAFGYFSSLAREHASHFARTRAGSPWLN